MLDVIIIGAGVSGLCMAKWCHQFKLQFIILEQNDSIGGVWYDKVLDETELQSPKSFYQFNDIPMSNDYPEFPSSKEVLKYLNFIKDKICSNKNIIFNSKVIDYFFRDLWIVTYLNDNINKTIKSKYLVVCNGVFNKPKKITISNFRGNIYYSKDVNRCNFHNKNITIIGSGASSIDCQKKFCQNNTIYVLSRSPKWYMLKKINNKSTYKLINRVLINTVIYLPVVLFILFFKILSKLFIKNPLITPESKFNSKNIIMASQLIFDKIREKKIIYLNNTIKKCFKNTIVLDDNKFINSDLIIICAGYEREKMFRSDKLFKYIIDPEIENCGFIGQTFSYNWLQVSNLQARWFVNYIIGNIKKVDYTDQLEYIRKYSQKKNDNLEYDDLTYWTFKYCDELLDDLNMDKPYFSYKYWFENPIY